ncbi:hypothetical protein BDQ17DRAFT_1337834 [Cyathus striatus]|nr:hypothetical protein BDQ17DRAFT_1337834 [Cyathus striatus]
MALSESKPLQSLPEMPVFFQTRFIPILLALLSITKAVIVNITVDDTYPDPLTGQFFNYLPNDSWNNGPTCDTVLQTLTEKRCTMEHGTTVQKCYICILCHLLSNAVKLIGSTNMTFYIDNEVVGHFERIPGFGSQNYQYNYQEDTHSCCKMDRKEVEQFINSLRLPDLLKYSYDSAVEPTTSVTTPAVSSSSQTFPKSTSSGSKALAGSVGAALIGGTVGAIVGALITVASICIWVIRRRRKPAVEDPTIPNQP